MSTNENPDLDNTKLNELVEDLGSDYANYVHVNVKQEVGTLEEELEDLLMRLDEFSSLVDMVRSDDALCLNNTLPEIYLKSQEIEPIYEKIDKFEYVVGTIKKNLDTLEEKVSEAEHALEGGTMRKLLSSLSKKPLFSKKSGESKKSPKYEAPEIFSALGLFNMTKTDSEKLEAVSEVADEDSKQVIK